MHHTHAQEFMRERGIDAWLVHDFRGSNSVLSQLLPGKRFLTRRVGLVIPARGEPTLIVSHIDASSFKGVDVARRLYLTWKEYHAAVREVLGGARRVAMEYSAGCDLPVVGIVDAGTVELVRAMGPEVVSSADLIQATVARWSAEATANHERACAATTRIMADAFAFIRAALAAGTPTDEFRVVQRIREHFGREGLEYPDGPIVAVNGHAGDPHFEPSETSPSPIRAGDWVLIDLWGRVPGDENIHSDITWVGCCGTPSERQVKVFEAVRGARDAAVALAQDRWRAKRAVQGWEIDEAAMGVLRDSGFGEGIRHRTGHSLSPGPKVHGLGVNIDNTETRDTREMLAGVGFTVEPGLYFSDFGVRLEVDVFNDPASGPRITSCVQREIERLG
ncbi:MAG: Xaa-Pro peptidase family protein [Planctomycetota bacterium]|nr:Xaa-Pro peptidase family protein [Planctomycetota bacterium]